MKPKARLLQLLLLAGSSLLAICSTSAQTAVNWDGDTSAAWGNAGNWDTAPVSSLTANIANFNLAAYGGNPVYAPNAGTTSIAGLTIGALNGPMTLTTTNLSIGASGISISSGAGALSVTGTLTVGASSSQSWLNNSANLFLSASSVVIGTNTLTIGGSGNTTFSGVVSGTNGNLTKSNAGTLTLSGTAANTYSGLTTVNAGLLELGKTANVVAIANGGITINGGTVRYTGTSTDMMGSGAVNIKNTGTLDIQGINDTVGTITLAQGGSITGTTGILTTGSGGLVSNDGGTISGFSSGAGLRLGGGITYNSTGPGSTTLQIDRIFVPDLSPTFNIADGDAAIDFEITGTLSGGGNNIARNLTKTGAGVMQLSGGDANTTGINQMPLAIWDGTVIFNKSAEVNALPNSNITIGDGAGSAGSAILQYKTSNNQLATNLITINSDGLFDLNGRSESLGGLTVNSTGQLQLNNGSLTVTSLTLNPSAGNTTTVSLGGTGILTLGGDVTLNAAGTGRAQINGSELSLGGANRIFNVGLGTGADYDLLIGAGISGARSLTKNGGGRLALTGSNSYTLGTVVNAGTLQIGDGTTAGTMTSTGALTMGGGTFAVRGPASGGSSQTVASLVTTASTRSFITLAPGASGDTTLTITSNTPTTGGGSTLNFNYTAGTTVGGTVGNNYVVWNATLTGGIIGGAYTVTDSGGTGFATLVDTNKVVRLTDPGSAGLPTSTGSATDSYFVNSSYSTDTDTTPGSLVLALSGAVAASNVTVDTTGLASGANLALGTNLLTLGAGMVFSGPNPYEITGTGGLRAASAGGTIHFYNTSTSTVGISAPIVDNTASRLTVEGTGTTVLSGTNTYSGVTTINGGTLRLANQNAAQNSTVTMGGGSAALTFDASVSGNAFTLGSLAAVAAGTGYDISLMNNAAIPAPIALTVGGNNASTTYAGVLSGTGASLVKAGSGALILSGTNTFSGGISINAGTLQLPTGPTAANLGDSGNVITFTGSATFSSPSVTLSQDFVINSGATATLFGGHPTGHTYNGTLTGSGTLRVRGNGGLTADFRSTDNTFSGDISLGSNTGGYIGTLVMNSLADTIPGGRLNMGETNRAGVFTYGTGAAVSLVFTNRQIALSGTTSGGTLNNNATNANVTVTVNTNLLVTGAGNKSFTLGGGNAGDNTFSGLISDSVSPAAVISVTKADGGKWLVTNSSNSYTGGTTVSAGTLGFANGSLGTSGTINASGGTLLWNSGNTQDISSRLAMTAATTTTLNTNGNNVTFASPIGGSTSGALTKAGAGTLLLSGTNTYTGLTTVNDGTLGGSCTVGGAVTVNAAGSLAPGVSAGTLAINGNLTLTNQVNGGSGKLKFELGANGLGTSDRITVNGNLTLGGNFLNLADFEFSTLTGLENGTYPLITYTGTLSGNVAAGDLTGTINGVGGTADVTLQINTTTKTVELVVSNVSSGSLYETWANATYVPPLTAKLPGDDQDADGFNNLMEYAFGTQPTVAASGSIVWVDAGAVTTPGQPVAINMANPGVDFRAVFGRRKDHVAAGLTYTVEFSAGLDVWVASGDTPTVLTGAGGLNPSDIEAVSVPYPLLIPVGNNEFKKPTFFRVKITGP